MVCSLINTDTRHHSGQNLLWTQFAVDSQPLPSPQQILTIVRTRIFVHKRTDHAKPHFDLFFYHNINVKENVFLWTLIDHGKLGNQVGKLGNQVGKLGNQVARLVAIVVKNSTELKALFSISIILGVLNLNPIRSDIQILITAIELSCKSSKVMTQTAMEIKAHLSVSN